MLSRPMDLPLIWNWVVNEGAIIIGVITLITTALLLWCNLNCFTRILISISSSAGIFELCWWSLMWNSVVRQFDVGLVE